MLLTLALAAAVSLATSAHAQVVVQPIGLSHPNAAPWQTVAAVTLPVLDREQIAAEDNARVSNGQPARFAIPNDVSISPDTHGTWEVLDAKWSLWRLRVRCPNADHINFGFGSFSMPGGGRMQLYSSDGVSILRPFDSSDHQPSGQLWTPVVFGKDVTCEVYVPTTAIPQLQLDLVQISSGYRFFGAGPTALSNNDGSGPCNIDVNCSQGVGWENEISSVAAYSTGGAIFCTGAMINNTAQDGRNFFLTANHCGIGPGQASSLVCYWNYENTACGGNNAPLNQFTTGATYRASWSTSDFTLVELNSTPNPAWGVTYAGWNRGAATSPNATAIHHPSGDAKKISFENQPTTHTSYGGSSPNSNGTHVRVADWDLGTTEPGSSGSPLFDNNHRIIGQLHGGAAACGNNSPDWYGRFFRSWTGGNTSNSRLSNWLDPTGSGALVVDTLGGSAGGVVASATAYGAGCYSSFGTISELFAGNQFDLSGTATIAQNIRFTPTANGYDVSYGQPLWQPPLSPNLTLGDDALHSVTLPFTLNYPGGATNVVRFCTNGYVWLGNSTVADWSPTVAELVSGPARLCPAWFDMNPTAGGSCHYDVVGGVAHFTWNNVPAYTSGAPGPGNTLQVAIFPNGTVDFRYRQVPNQPADCIVGFTRGGTQTPPNTDFSLGLPASVSVDASGLGWSGVNRPILGATQAMQLTNIPAPAQSIGLAVVGFQAIPSGADLAFIGAPGCRLYTQSVSIQVMNYPVLGASHLWLLPIPNNPALSGSKVTTQGIIKMPSTFNPGGFLSSNGVELLLGTL
ncbi:MAG: trypsin-like peptidase domain-containing protein [Planctomycetota bacterium]